MDILKFKHSYQLQVRDYEIDWQGIVHNVNYLLYFEVARVNYFKGIDLKINEHSSSASIRIVLVRNEIDYFNSAADDDWLKIYTRISSIKNSSFVSEALMFNAETNIPIAKNSATHVWTDPKTKKSIPVPNNFRKLVDKYENGNAEIFWPALEV